MSGLEAAGLALSAKSLVDKVLAAYDTLLSSQKDRQFRRAEALIAALKLYHDAYARLQILLKTDAQFKLSSAQLANLDGLCQSSLALCTSLYQKSSELLAAKTWRKSDEKSLNFALFTIQDLTFCIDAECGILEQPLESKAFDEALYASAAYARTENAAPTAAIPKNEVEYLFEQHAPNQEYGAPSAAGPHQRSEPSEAPVYEDGFSISDIHTMTSAFKKDVESLSADPHANKVEKPIIVLDRRGKAVQLMALLDTGATVNCVAEAHVKAMGSKFNMAKLPCAKSSKQADSSYIDVTHVMKCKWQLQGKQKWYMHIFHVVPDLPRDLIIARQVIFEHDFLTDNIECCSLGLPKEFKEIPQLYVLGMAAQSKATKEEQSLKAKQKQKANEEERQKKLEALKQQYAERSAAASQTTASSLSQASGSASGTGTTSNRS